MRQHSPERDVVKEQRGVAGGQAELGAPNYVDDGEHHSYQGDHEQTPSAEGVEPLAVESLLPVWSKVVQSAALINPQPLGCRRCLFSDTPAAGVRLLGPEAGHSEQAGGLLELWALAMDCGVL